MTAARSHSALVGHIGVSLAPFDRAPVSSGDVVDAVLTIRRAILSGPPSDIRAIQGELAYLRRHARRALRRAS